MAAVLGALSTEDLPRVLPPSHGSLVRSCPVSPQSQHGRRRLPPAALQEGAGGKRMRDGAHRSFLSEMEQPEQHPRGKSGPLGQETGTPASALRPGPRETLCSQTSAAHRQRSADTAAERSATLAGSDSVLTPGGKPGRRGGQIYAPLPVSFRTQPPFTAGSRPRGPGQAVGTSIPKINSRSAS